jgi:hypothetical protein
MAIVSCPDCDKNISSHTVECPYCGFQRDAIAEEKLREIRRRKLRDHIYHLKMTSYVALTLLITSIGWYLVETSGLQYRSSLGPYVLFTIGAVSYLVIRVYLHKFKADLRKRNF